MTYQRQEAWKLAILSTWTQDMPRYLPQATSWAPATDGAIKETADKTWDNFKAHFSAAHSHYKHMQGESTSNSGYHAANAAVGKTEDQMDEATIGSFAKLATSTATDRDVAVTLTEANSHLARQLEDHSNELKDIKALIKKERAW
jgi:hypothetical protein